MFLFSFCIPIRFKNLSASLHYSCFIFLPKHHSKTFVVILDLTTRYLFFLQSLFLVSKCVILLEVIYLILISFDYAILSFNSLQDFFFSSVSFSWLILYLLSSTSRSFLALFEECQSEYSRPQLSIILIGSLFVFSTIVSFCSFSSFIIQDDWQVILHDK